MKLIHMILLRYMLPLFFISLFFFVILLEIVDLFSNIVRYQNLKIPVKDIIRLQLLYIPRCVSYALPIALLFSGAVSMSMLYANNELISILASGTAIYTITLPAIIIGLTFAVLGFLFDEFIVIETFREKNELTKVLLRSSETFNNANVAVRSKDGRIIYYVDYYNDKDKTFTDLTVVEFTEEGIFDRRLEAATAEWDEDKQLWKLKNITVYKNTGTKIDYSQEKILEDAKYNILPASFQYREWEIDELTLNEARGLLIFLQGSGRDFREQLTSFYSRFSFAVTPIIVMLISCALAGKFRKNIILMSLLLSLATAVIYYVFRSITLIMASNGILEPLVGAWLASVVFLIIGIVLYKQAAT